MTTHADLLVAIDKAQETLSGYAEEADTDRLLLDTLRAILKLCDEQSWPTTLGNHEMTVVPARLVQQVVADALTRMVTL